MAELREYRYVANGVTITAMLDEHDAARLNATPTQDDAGASDVVTVAGKARTASNAARTPHNKAR